MGDCGQKSHRLVSCNKCNIQDDKGISGLERSVSLHFISKSVRSVLYPYESTNMKEKKRRSTHILREAFVLVQQRKRYRGENSTVELNQQHYDQQTTPSAHSVIHDVLLKSKINTSHCSLRFCNQKEISVFMRGKNKNKMLYKALSNALSSVLALIKTQIQQSKKGSTRG